MNKNGPEQLAEQKLSTVLIKLLQGHIQSEDALIWETLLVNRSFAEEYFEKIGLYLHLSEVDGFAYLRSFPVLQTDESEQESDLPAVMRKMPLSYETSLLCVLLRKELDRFDYEEVDDQRCIVETQDIYEMLSIFFPDWNDETKLQRRFDSIINKVKELGFIRRLNGKNEKYEIKRILRAYIGAETLENIQKQLKEISPSTKMDDVQ